jgi:cationic amino acid transporter 14
MQKKQKVLFGDKAVTSYASNPNAAEEINNYTKFIGRLITSLACCIVGFDLMLVIFEYFNTFESQSVLKPYALLLVVLGILLLIGHLLALSNFTQIKPRGFETPCVPLVPSLGILINIYLMLRLSSLTLIRFTIWMVLGFVIYFKSVISESIFHDSGSVPSEVTSKEESKQLP